MGFCAAQCSPLVGDPRATAWRRSAPALREAPRRRSRDAAAQDDAAAMSYDLSPVPTRSTHLAD